MNMGSTSSPPVKHRNFSLEIMGNKTEIVVLDYEDHILVIATQIGTMGTILHARKEGGMSINPTFNVSVIFGKRDEPMLEACARQLIEHISSSGSSRPLVLALGLKDHSTETLKAKTCGNELQPCSSDVLMPVQGIVHSVGVSLSLPEHF